MSPPGKCFEFCSWKCAFESLISGNCTLFIIKTHQRDNYLTLSLYKITHLQCSTSYKSLHDGHQDVQ